MSELKKIAPGKYLLEKKHWMHVPGLIIGNEELLLDPEIEKPLEQVANVASLPGILGYSIAMPDMHWGYGFPIGGVAAMDWDSGVISPGGVGYDINCGVRLALVPIAFDKISEQKKKELLDEIFRRVPSGVGHGHDKSSSLSDIDYHALAEEGAQWSVQKGYGFQKDLESIESHGRLSGADISLVSPLAKMRGARQLGSIGSGNHFIEIGSIQSIEEKDIATAWGVEKGQTYILIHTGSRGFGHQICQDTLDAFLSQGFAKGLKDKQLVCAPIQSEEGQNYLKCMAAAANFAFNNRQRILHLVRLAFEKVLHIAPESIPLLYDVCHNIAKKETHFIEGKSKQVCVHRKGATRAFGPHHPELAAQFQTTGQPVLVPGDMGRASYLMAGLGSQDTFCSCCHGAGRAKSRIKSLKEWASHDLRETMKKRGILVQASSFKTIAEEMPDAYKDVNAVVEASQEAGLARKVAKLKPALVVKG